MLVAFLIAVSGAVSLRESRVMGATAAEAMSELNLERGIVAVMGLAENDVDMLVDLCKSSDLIIYYQTDDSRLAAKAREAASQANLLGQSLFIEH